MTLRTLQIDDRLFRYVVDASVREHGTDASASRSSDHRGARSIPVMGGHWPDSAMLVTSKPCR